MRVIGVPVAHSALLHAGMAGLRTMNVLPTRASELSSEMDGAADPVEEWVDEWCVPAPLNESLVLVYPLYRKPKLAQQRFAFPGAAWLLLQSLSAIMLCIPPRVPLSAPTSATHPPVIGSQPDCCSVG